MTLLGLLCPPRPLRTVPAPALRSPTLVAGGPRIAGQGPEDFHPHPPFNGIDFQQLATDAWAARDYLAQLFVEMSTHRAGWDPAESDVWIANIRALDGPREDVIGMLSRVQVNGPPLTWPGAQKWYAVLGHIWRRAEYPPAGAEPPAATITERMEREAAAFNRELAEIQATLQAPWTFTTPAWGEDSSILDWWTRGADMLAELALGPPAGEVAVPREAVDPFAARDYMADLLWQMALSRGWHLEESSKRRKAIRETVITSPLVEPLVERIRPHGPPLAWTGAEKWYAVLDQLARTASTVRHGAELNRWTVVATDYAVQQSEAVSKRVGGWFDLGEVLARGVATAAPRAGPAAGAALGGGLGLALGAGAFVLAIYAFGPEVAAARQASRARVAERKLAESAA